MFLLFYPQCQGLLFKPKTDADTWFRHFTYFCFHHFIIYPQKKQANFGTMRAPKKNFNKLLSKLGQTLIYNEIIITVVYFKLLTENILSCLVAEFSHTHSKYCMQLSAITNFCHLVTYMLIVLQGNKERRTRPFSFFLRILGTSIQTSQSKHIMIYKDNRAATPQSASDPIIFILGSQSFSSTVVDSARFKVTQSWLPFRKQYSSRLTTTLQTRLQHPRINADAKIKSCFRFKWSLTWLDRQFERSIDSKD